MSAAEHLSPLQFQHSEDDAHHEVNAYHGGQHVGTMVWAKQPSETPFRHREPPGAIDMVIVDPEKRRQGVASSMLQEGRKYTPRPRHSRERTEDGDAWAAATSKRPPKNPDPGNSLRTMTWEKAYKKPDQPYQAWMF